MTRCPACGRGRRGPAPFVRAVRVAWDAVLSLPMQSRGVCILLEAADPFPAGPSYFLWGLRDAWIEMGIPVRVARGVGELDASDLVVPHIDRTVTPPEFRSALDGLPNVANRGVYDISKRRVSSHLLEQGSCWEGPVIVKTDLNYGGRPERRVITQGGWSRMTARWKRSLRRRVGLASEHEYRVFGALREVPRRVFRNRRLVVERFLPEREGGAYWLRWYIFCGDRYRSMRVASTDPIVKRDNLTQIQFGLEIPAAVLQVREDWGLDIGKIDFVMHDGEPVILDINRTPADIAPPRRTEVCRPFGPGVLSLLSRGSGPRVSPEQQDVDAMGGA